MERLLDPPAPSDESDAGGFITVREVAQGGMGNVVEVRDRSLKRSVAMKVMRDDARASASARRRFRREAEVLGRLEHPNIVPIHEQGVDEEGRPFYTMKLVKGRTLRAILDDLKEGMVAAYLEWNLDSLLNVFRKVGDAMAFAHSRGVVHRDLKPDNVMVGEFGEVLVMDWGLAKILDGPEEESETVLDEPGIDLGNLPVKDSSLTMDGAVLGTPQFMSPEQAAGRMSGIDARSDVFSLGAILYQILTLRPPIRGDSVEEVLGKVRTGAFEAPTHFNPVEVRKRRKEIDETEQSTMSRTTGGRLKHCPGGRVPEALSAVTMRAMEFQAEDRYRSVTALMNDIEAYQRGFATSAERIGTLGQLWLLIKRHRVVSCLLLMMLIGGTIFMLRLMASESRAQTARAAADLEADNARKAEQVARREQETTREALADAKIALADSAYQNRDVVAMGRLLDGVPADLRNNQWRYLNTIRKPSLGAVRGAKGNIFYEVDHIPGTKDQFVAGDVQGNLLIYGAAERKVLGRIPTGLKAPLRLSVSADGKRVAVGASGGESVFLYDLKSGEKRGRIPMTTGKLFRLHFVGPGSERLLVSERSKANIRLVDPNTAETLWFYKSSSQTASDPSGRFVAVHHSNVAQDVRVLDARTGKVLRTMDADGERSYIWTLGFSPDSKTLAAGDHFGDVHLWDVDSGRLTGRFNAGSGRLQCLQFEPNGMLITCCEEAREDGRSQRSIRVWNHRTFKEIKRLPGVGLVESSFAYHSDSGYLATRGEALNIYRINLTAPAWTLECASAAAFTEFLSDDLLVAFTGRDQHGVHRLGDGEPARLVWKAKQPEHLASTAANGENVLLVSRRPRNPSAHLVRVTTENGMSSLATPRIPSAVNAVAVNQDGNMAAFGLRTGGLTFTQTHTGDTVHRIDHPLTQVIKSVRWLDKGSTVVTLSQGLREQGMASDVLAVWKLNSHQPLRAVTNRFAARGIAVHPRDERVALVGSELSVRIYQSPELELVEEFRAHDHAINSVAFHPSLPILATASDDMSVRIWNLKNCRRIEEFLGAARAPMGLDFSPNGERLAVACGDKKTRVYRTGHLAGLLLPDAAKVFSETP